MKTKITGYEKLQLLGLLVLAIKHQRLVNQLEEAMADLVEDELGGLLSDAIYDGNSDIDGLLKNMKIEVEE